MYRCNYYIMWPSAAHEEFDMKTVLIAGVALMISAAAFAGPEKTKTPEKIECAVMKGKTVDIKSATASKMFADYKGKRYFFCCGGCPAEFKSHSDKYAKGPSIPTPKETKSKKA